MYELILLGLVALIAGICMVVSLVRGFSKSLVRLGTAVLSAVGAVVTCLVMKDQLPTSEALIELIQNNNLVEAVRTSFGADAASAAETLVEFSGISPTLIELLIQLVAALALPILCVVLFFLYFAITGIVYLILKKVLSIPLSNLNRAVPMSRLFATVVGLLEGVAILMVVMLPISGYIAIAQPTVEGLESQGILDPEKPAVQVVDAAVSEINDSAALTVYRTIGGKAMTNSVMQMRVAGMDVNLEEELDPILGMVVRVKSLGENELAQYGQREADLIRAIGESFADSKLMAPIAGDVIYAASEAWLKGETFLGAEKPNLGESAELFDPFLNTLLEILHDDAKASELLCEDVNTTAELVACLAQSGVLANMNDTQTMLSSLSSEGVVENMIHTLGVNERMKRLIPEVTNMGMRAIGQVLNLPKNVDTVYDNFMGNVAGALNDVRGLSEEEKISVLSERLNTAFDTAGVPIDDEIIDFYSTSMIHDLITNNPDGEVTAEDVKAFFLMYAENASDQGASMAAGYPSFDMLANEDDPFAGTVYGRMTEEERKNTATAMLAKICNRLSELDADAEDFSEQAKAIVTEGFSEVLGEDNAAMEVLKNTEITKPVSGETIQNTASFQSVESMKETTVVITVEDLLVDTKAAAEGINSDTLESEVGAISAVFGSAGSLLDTLGGENKGEVDIATIAGSLGGVLDALKESGSVGEEKTANLFTAVLQSETVREKAGLDMTTATEMAKEATAGDADYTKTMSVVSGSLGVAEKLSKDTEVSDEEIMDMIRNLTPQTSAMLRIYMNGDRMVRFGVPAKNADVSAELMSSIFTYMARDDIQDYDAEARGLNQVLQIALSARDSSKSKVFSTSAGANDGRLPTASSTVDSMLGSEAVVYALIDVLTDGSSVTNFDPFGYGEKFAKDPQGVEDLRNALTQYRASHPEVSSLAVEALAAAFGVTL